MSICGAPGVRVLTATVVDVERGLIVVELLESIAEAVDITKVAEYESRSLIIHTSTSYADPATRSRKSQV
jgi:hypothetical protein